jgi:hypothetical protein
MIRSAPAADFAAGPCPGLSPTPSVCFWLVRHFDWDDGALAQQQAAAECPDLSCTRVRQLDAK